MSEFTLLLFILQTLIEMEKNSSGNQAEDEPKVCRQKSQLSVYSAVSRLCRRIGTSSTVNRVLANIYTQPLGKI